MAQTKPTLAVEQQTLGLERVLKVRFPPLLPYRPQVRVLEAIAGILTGCPGSSRWAEATNLAEPNGRNS